MGTGAAPWWAGGAAALWSLFTEHPGVPCNRLTAGGCRELTHLGSSSKDKSSLAPGPEAPSLLQLKTRQAARHARLRPHSPFHFKSNLLPADKHRRRTPASAQRPRSHVRQRESPKEAAVPIHTGCLANIRSARIHVFPFISSLACMRNACTAQLMSSA